MHRFVPLLVALWMVAGLAVGGRPNTKTTLTLFHSGWCSTLCENAVAAVAAVQESLAEQGLSDQYTAVAVDCSKISQGSTCCRHRVNTYPTVHVTPKGARDFWVYQGERDHDQMLFALVEDNAPKALQSLSPAGALSCSAKALKYSMAHFVTRTISGSALLGAIIGGLVVHSYVTMRAMKFGTRKVDYGVLIGTVLVMFLLCA